jgi:hypothetical protein
MVVVAGTDRSGTGVMAKFLHSAGLKVANARWSRRTRSGFEVPEIRFYNHKLAIELQRGVGWKDAYYHLKLKQEIDKLKANNIALIKDVFIIRHAEIIRVWHHLIPEMKVLFLYRKPEDIIKSRKAYERQIKKVIKGNMTSTKAIDTIRENIISFKTSLKELDIPHKIFIYPQYLLNYEKVRLALKSLEIKGSFSKKLWDKTIDLNMVSFW